jgi:hypothetical protein
MDGTGGTIALERGLGQLDTQRLKDHLILVAGAIAPFSQIIHDLNECFGTDFSEEDRVVISHLVQTLIAALHCFYPQLLPKWLRSMTTEAVQKEAEELKWALHR